jgi:pyrroloquinoline quinone (PQQ) biosynthesis protein C
LALQDLNSLGYSIESFPELPATSSFYHSLYYFLNYENSLSILGYKLPLEGFACQDSQKFFYEKMVGLYGESSTSFLKVHDSEDVSHYQQGLEMLQMCESKDLIVICKVCQQLSYAFGAMTEAIAKKHLNK